MVGLPGRRGLVLLALGLGFAFPRPVYAGKFEMVPKMHFEDRQRAVGKQTVESSRLELHPEVTFEGSDPVTAEIDLGGTTVNVLAQRQKSWTIKTYDRPMAALAGLTWMSLGVATGYLLLNTESDAGPIVGAAFGIPMFTAGAYWTVASISPVRRRDVQETVERRRETVPARDLSGVTLELTRNGKSFASLVTDAASSATYVFESSDPELEAWVEVRYQDQQIGSFSPFESPAFTDVWLRARVTEAREDRADARERVQRVAALVGPSTASGESIASVLGCLDAWSSADRTPVESLRIFEGAQTAPGVVGFCASTALEALPQLPAAALAVTREREAREAADARRAARAAAMCEEGRAHRVEAARAMYASEYVDRLELGLSRLQDSTELGRRAAEANGGLTDRDRGMLDCLGEVASAGRLLFRSLNRQRGRDFDGSFDGLDTATEEALQGMLAGGSVCESPVRDALGAGVTGPLSRHQKVESRWGELGCDEAARGQ